MSKHFLLSVFFIASLISCTKNKELTLVDSTGRINHVMIVMKNSDWQGKAGDALRDIIAKPVVGLPQDEPQFTINQVPPETFNDLFKRSRNILFVGYSQDAKNNFYTNSNVYAQPQISLTILAKNEEELIENINKHENEIIATFKNKDLQLYQNKITKNFRQIKSVETFNKLGFSLKIPVSYNEVEDTGDFVWYRNDITKGQLNIFAFEIPYTTESDFTKEAILAATDTITKQQIPGQFEGTYMMIEPKYDPVTKTVKLAEKETLENRGLWIVKDDYMGGPFINYAILDKKNNRILILQGFSYSPATKKRDFVFELESILKTVTLY
jgi:hypothetical protein